MATLSEKEMSEINGGASSPYFTYTVVYGDTLSGIAVRFHTTVATLQKLNNIPNADKIKAGQVLLIPRT